MPTQGGTYRYGRQRAVQRASRGPGNSGEGDLSHLPCRSGKNFNTSWPVVAASRLRLIAVARASGSSTLWPWYADVESLAPGIWVVREWLLTLLLLPVRYRDN